MEKLGQLRRTGEGRQLGPDRGRHPAQPLRTGLPRRPEPPRRLPRRPADQGADGPGEGRRRLRDEGPGRRPVDRHDRTEQAPRLRPPAGRADLRRLPGVDVRRLPPARDETYRSSRHEGTAFLVVAAPEPDALREAAYFTERLAAENMPLAGLILNRVHPGDGPGTLSGEGPRRSRGTRRRLPGPPPGRRPARLHAERMRLSARERRLAEGSRHRIPGSPWPRSRRSAATSTIWRAATGGGPAGRSD